MNAQTRLQAVVAERDAAKAANAADAAKLETLAAEIESTVARRDALMDSIAAK